MKKSGFSVLAITFAAAFAVLQSGVALAQWGAEEKRERIATPMTVASIYHIMQRKLPDFTAWARESEAYKKADGFDKNVVLDREISRLKNEFSEISPFEPLVIKTRIKLSPYSERTKGYLLRGITPETYFGYTYMGINYAIILPKLMDYEWIGVDAAQLRDIEAAVQRSPDREIVLKIKARINYADKNPVTMQKDPYFLMSGDITSLELFDRRDDTRAVWWMDSKETLNAVQQELLNLKR